MIVIYGLTIYNNSLAIIVNRLLFDIVIDESFIDETNEVCYEYPF